MFPYTDHVRIGAQDISLVHAANVSILRQDQSSNTFHLSVLPSLYNFVLLSYRQIDAHAEHEEGLQDIY